MTVTAERVAPTGKPRRRSPVKRWRTLLVWVHVLVSIAWMAEALALLTLVLTSYFSTDATTALGAARMAEVLDKRLLGPFANATAFTGFVLAAATPWGYFRNSWVLTKFAITIVQLVIGIFVLSAGLTRIAEAIEVGRAPVLWPSLIGTALMASAIAFQGWVSLAKPWGKTRLAARGPTKLPTAPVWVFVLAVCAVAGDIALGQLFGFPAPALGILVLLAILVDRARRLRGMRRS